MPWRFDVPLLIISPPGAIPDCPWHLFEPSSILPHDGWMGKSRSRGLLGQRSRKAKSYSPRSRPGKSGHRCGADWFNL